MPEVVNELYKQISVGGPDAIEFLQGQLTQDVSLLAKAGRLLAAWCNPKGRVVTTMRLIRLGETVGLVVPATMADSVGKRLAMYRLRSAVDFVPDDVGWKEHIDHEDADPELLIRSGVPTIDATNTEKYTPHMLNLDKLGAISFSKGCYTGQEVVARTENLGKSKRRMMRYRAEKNGIEVGGKLSDGDRNVGEVVNILGRELLAVTPVELHLQSLTINGVVCTPMGLPYSI